jgi:hypothetical protein
MRESGRFAGGHVKNSVLILVALAACGPKGSTTEVDSVAAKVDRITAHQYTERPTGDGLIQQEIDLNRDGKPEIVNYLRERAAAARLLVRKEVDLNYDGRIDVVTLFTETGEIDREEMDSDFDGSFDWVDHYREGRRVMTEVDTDFDGKMNIFSYYEEGKISRKERDTNGDGMIDMWEKFDRDGNVIRTGLDTDGDGKMDERDD